MKFRGLPLKSSIALTIGFAAFGATAAGSATAKVLYEVTHLEAPGLSHRGHSINERGWVSGFTVRSATLRQATLWKGTEATLLESIAGPTGNSNVIWDGLNNSGTIVGISQTGQPDPRGEAWSCSAFGVGPICLGFAWKDGEFTPLPAFPGGDERLRRCRE